MLNSNISLQPNTISIMRLPLGFQLIIIYCRKYQLQNSRRQFLRERRILFFIRRRKILKNLASSIFFNSTDNNVFVFSNNTILKSNISCGKYSKTFKLLSPLLELSGKYSNFQVVLP